MRFMIIGANGFIGSELTYAACSGGHRVLGCDVSPAPRDAAATLAGFEYLDVSEQPPGESAFAGVDCVILLAATRPYPDFNINDYYRNVELSNVYFELAMKHGVKDFLFASTKAVYSGDGTPWRERDAKTPLSLYGASKLATENLGLYYSSCGKLCFKSLRIAQIIGAGERKGYLINTLIDNAKAKKPQTIFGSGEQRRQYVYIKDVCRAFLAAAVSQTKYGVYNIGMPDTISNLEMAQCINSVFGSDAGVVHDYSQEMRGSSDSMDVGLAESELGFRTKYDLREAIEDIINSGARNN